ncbi:MAG TPA: hypothetical protein VN878_05390 [Usitatibacter sp.]|nr:hypothetical protein [Usitatibacter sp.]
MSYDFTGNGRDRLRVSLRQHDIERLMALFPKLARTEIVDVITRVGPLQPDVEDELTRLSQSKI